MLTNIKGVMLNTMYRYQPHVEDQGEIKLKVKDLKIIDKQIKQNRIKAEP